MNFEIHEYDANLRETDALITDLETELAALKARRCEGCKQFFINYNRRGCAFINCFFEGPGCEVVVRDFACNSWIGIVGKGGKT
jgi:hypothetical protein